MRKFFMEILLFGVTIIWGLAFVWQSITGQQLGPLTVVGFRSLIAVVFLIILAIIMPALYKSQNPKLVKNPSVKHTVLVAIICGVVLFFAMYIQQIGIVMTTAGKAGFISVLYICIVPLFSYFFGAKLNKFFLIGLVLCVIGFYLLSIKDQFYIEKGDMVVFLSAILFGIHIFIIGWASSRSNAMLLSILQLFVVALLSLGFASFKEEITLERIMKVLVPLLALGILSSGVAYTLQIVVQREIPAHIASVIMSFESVVATIGGFFILGEVLTTKEMIGMTVVFFGILISQLREKRENNLNNFK